MICVKFTAFCDLRADLRIRLATLRSPYASSGFANLRWLASTCESVWPGLILQISLSCFSAGSNLLVFQIGWVLELLKDQQIHFWVLAPKIRWLCALDIFALSQEVRSSKKRKSQETILAVGCERLRDIDGTAARSRVKLMAPKSFAPHLGGIPTTCWRPSWQCKKYLKDSGWIMRSASRLYYML